MLVPPRTRDLGLPAAEELERVRSVQTHMRLLGYPVPRDDGVLDEETRAAIRAFQKRVGITPDGRMSQRLQDQLQAEFNLCVVVRSMAAEPSSIDQHCARPAPTASASRLLGRGDPYAIVPPLREEERNDRAEAAPAGERGTRTR
jgi:peptidoglycan hydrolase-like protein with peptidoglycan-binding domain